MADEQREKNSKKKLVKKKSIFRTRTISIRSRRYGTLKLKGLTLGSMEVLETLRDVDISAREFTVQVIHHHLTSPEISIDELRTAPDRFLTRVATVWAEHEEAMNKKLPEGAPPFDAFKQVASEILAEQHQRMSGLFADLQQSMPKITFPIAEHLEWLETFKVTTSFIDFKWLDDIKAALIPSSLENIRTLTDTLDTISIQTNLESIWKSVSGFANVTEQISQSLQEIVNSLQPAFDISNLIQSFPSPGELIRQWEETRQAEEALKVSGYGFSAHLWETAFVIGFARVNPKVRAASVTNKLLAMTRSSEFAEVLRSSIQSSSTLMRRQRVILRALEAHTQRDYIVSVPLLLSQLEGVVGDILRLRGLVIIKGGKVYAKEADGKIKLAKDGKPVELKGLAPLIARAKWRSHPVLDRAADLLTTQLIGDRNEILHGRRTSYSSAKLSTQALLLLLVLAKEIAAFEAGKVTPSA